MQDAMLHLRCGRPIELSDGENPRGIFEIQQQYYGK